MTHTRTYTMDKRHAQDTIGEYIKTILALVPDEQRVSVKLTVSLERSVAAKPKKKAHTPKISQHEIVKQFLAENKGFYTKRHIAQATGLKAIQVATALGRLLTLHPDLYEKNASESPHIFRQK